MSSIVPAGQPPEATETGRSSWKSVRAPIRGKVAAVASRLWARHAPIVMRRPEVST